MRRAKQTLSSSDEEEYPSVERGGGADRAITCSIFDFYLQSMKRTVHSRSYLKDNRVALRNDLTSAEAVLWGRLKAAQLYGRKFRRQHSIENYIADFYCASERLVIELDGAGHFNIVGALNDEERTKRLNELGYKVLRFENIVVFRDIDWVLNEIRSLWSQR